jgi:hypothetical protein
MAGEVHLVDFDSSHSTATDVLKECCVAQTPLTLRLWFRFAHIAATRDTQHVHDKLDSGASLVVEWSD